MNTRPDQDAALDKLLKQAVASDRLPDAGPACLDAERAAALVDGGLLAAQRGEIEAHLAGCARCQALVASLVRSSAPAATPAAASATRGTWLGWTVPLAAAASVILAVVLWQGRGAEQEPAAGMPAMAARDAVSQARPAERETAPAPSPASGRTDAVPSAARPATPPAPSPVAVGQNAAATPERRDATGTGTRERDQAQASRMTESLQAAKAEMIVTSPDPAVRWRVRPASIERTTDGGSTWTATGVASDIDLTAGSAPSAGVCWMVGASGTVLRTTDGRTWQRLPFPEAASLTGVEATDERTATVTTTDGRRFRTTDGGSTWVQRRLQETPAAPF